MVQVRDQAGSESVPLREVPAQPNLATPRREPTVSTPAPTVGPRPDPYADERFAGISSHAFSERERAILCAAPTPEEVEKDEARGLWYMGHFHVRQRLNEAFGPGAWGLKPVGPPSAEDAGRDRKGQPLTLVLSTWDLYVRGSFAARATGECSYISGNPRMTRGDALEGSKSIALCRCAKDLGVGLQLFDPKFRATLGPGVKIIAAPMVEPTRKSAPQADAPTAKLAGRGAPPTVPSGRDRNPWIGRLVACEWKHGETARGPWKLWLLTADDGGQFGTFSETDGPMLESICGTRTIVEISWKPTKKGGRNIESWKATDAEPEAIASPGNPDIELGGGAEGEE